MAAHKRTGGVTFDLGKRRGRDGTRPAARSRALALSVLAVAAIVSLGFWFGGPLPALAEGSTLSASYDYGDLPDHTAGAAQSYATLLARDGARHVLDGVTFLGARADAEPDGRPELSAAGDDSRPLEQPNDEDGVAFLTPLAPGRAARIRVAAGSPGYLSAFIDSTGDGVLRPMTLAMGSPIGIAGSAIADLRLPAAGPYELWVIVPPDATGALYTRFRFTALAGQGGGSPSGPASSGEVEDYALAAVGSYAWLDLNNDGIHNEARDLGVNGVIARLADGNGNPIVDAHGSPLTRLTADQPVTGVPGWYEFAGLPAGNYRVQFVTDAYGFTTPYQGGDMTADSDANPSTGTTGVVRLAPGQVNPTIDAGLMGHGPTAVRLTSFAGRSPALPLRDIALTAAGSLARWLRQASE